MRWTSLATGLIVVLSASAAIAETPEFSSGRSVTAPLMRRGQLLSGQNWWTRYGEPVNAELLSKQPEMVEAGKAEIGAVSLHGHDYIYGLGACDCPPPCIDDLWSGYSQHPLRCVQLHRPWLRRQCRGGRLGHLGRGCCEPSCMTKSACGCAESVKSATPVEDLGCSKPVCGNCKHFHFNHGWKHFMAHWSKCDSCSSPIGCGCAMPLAPSVKPSFDSVPSPLPQTEDAALFTLPRIN
jgi:hypothetical protein